ALTDKAHEDIILTGGYSYRAFIENVDRDIAARTVRSARYELLAPIVASQPDGSHHLVLSMMLSLGITTAAHPVAPLLQHTESATGSAELIEVGPPSWARKLWHLLPMPVRLRIYRSIAAVLRKWRVAGETPGITYRAARSAWHCLPAGLR